MTDTHEEYRKQVLLELARLNLDSDTLFRVIGAIDYVSSNYELTVRQRSLIPASEINRVALGNYLADCGIQGQSKLTVRNKGFCLRKFLRTICIPITEMTTNDIRKYLYLVKQDTTDSNEEYVRLNLNAFFKFCVQEEIIEKNPCDRIKKIKCPKKEIQPLTDNQLDALRSNAKLPRDKALVELMYCTGARVSEVANLKLTDIDFELNEVHLYGKGKKYRTVFLSDIARIYLLEYLDLRHDKCPYVFVSLRKQNNGSPSSLSTRAIQYALKKLGKKSDITVRPHQIRHTTATNLQKTMPIQNISSYLGHEDLSTTMIYAKINKDTMRTEFANCMNTASGG